MEKYARLTACIEGKKMENNPQNMYQMISLKDYFPPIGEKVLIYRPHAHLQSDEDPNFKIAKYIGEGLWIGSYFKHEITHWLPLIKPL